MEEDTLGSLGMKTASSWRSSDRFANLLIISRDLFYPPSTSVFGSHTTHQANIRSLPSLQLDAGINTTSMIEYSKPLFILP